MERRYGKRLRITGSSLERFMDWFDRKTPYIRRHFQAHTDEQLAEAMGIPSSRVAWLRHRAGLHRTKEEKERIRQNPLSSSPPYTAEAPLPQEPVFLAFQDYLAAFVAASVALAVYVLTISPVIPGEDAGELVTAAFTGGIAHPSGYPLWCMLGWVFAHVPCQSVAWRVALLSGVFGALTVFVLYLFAMKLCKNRLAALGGAWALAFSGGFWAQSIIPEVYTLNEFLTVLCLLLMYLWYEQRKTGHLFLFAACYGLGLCNHHTMALLGPLFVGFAVLIDPRCWERWKRYAGCTLLALAMLSLYLYLPIRAATHPPMNWGDPETLDGFLGHILRRQYKLGFNEHPVSATHYAQQFLAYLKIYGWEFTPWLAWMPLVGAVLLWRKDKYLFTLLGGTAAIASVGMILVLNFQIDRQSLWLNNVFWIPAYLVGALGIAVAIDGIGRGLKRPTLVAGILLVPVAGSPLAAHYADNNKSHYFYADDFARNVLNTLEPNALYFPTADHATFPALYLQTVEGLRPDVTIGNKYGYPEKDLYQDMPPDILKTLSPIPSESEEVFIEDWIVRHTQRPVYFTRRRAMDGLAGYKLVNCGLLYRIQRPNEPWAAKDFWAAYTWRNGLEPETTRGELTADYILADYYFTRGRDYLAANEKEKALEAFARSLKTGGDTKETLNNLGSACAEYGLIDNAETYLAKAVEKDPTYLMALRNLAKVYSQKNNPAKALLQLENILRVQKDDREALHLSAQCLAQIEWYDEAIKRYQYLIEKNPEDAAAHRELGLLYFNHKQDPVNAHRYLSRSLEMDPNQPGIAELLAQPQAPAPPGLPTPPGAPQPAGMPANEGLPNANTGMPAGRPQAPGLPQGLQLPPSLPSPTLPGIPNDSGAL